VALASDSQRAKDEAIAGMRTLNRRASEILRAVSDRPSAPVHAVTDVTGYGLAGHGWEMAERADAAFVIDTDRLPIYADVLDAARRGVKSGGDARNRQAVEVRVRRDVAVDPAFETVAFDPQTSGGLLAAIDPAIVGDVVGASSAFVVIGRVEAGDAGIVLV
jgi:selenide,water dikinase